ncbi:MAG TPA: flagellar assembly protein FliW [Alphaproteobacteria bacterium]|nr:flagellar assembly protein FliW [Alphaproteobacteria bacterium]
MSKLAKKFKSEPSRSGAETAKRGEGNAEAQSSLTFKTRFGEVTLREELLVTFPTGLFGFTDCNTFGLAQLPNSGNSALLLLQCVNRPDVAFLVADPAMLGLEISAADRAEALEDTGLSATDTQFVTILTLYDGVDGQYLTANLRAPVMIDTANKLGTQYILGNTAYGTQQKI